MTIEIQSETNTNKKVLTGSLLDLAANLVTSSGVAWPTPSGIEGENDTISLTVTKPDGSKLTFNQNDFEGVFSLTITDETLA